MRCWSDFLSDLENMRTNVQRAPKPRQRYAQGGSVKEKMRKLAAEGRGGDTKLARIGPRTARMMDEIIHHGRAQRNPRTGLREYMMPGGGGAGVGGQGGIQQQWSQQAQQLQQQAAAAAAAAAPVAAPMGAPQGVQGGPPPGGAPQRLGRGPNSIGVTQNFAKRHIVEHDEDRLPPGDKGRNDQFDRWFDKDLDAFNDRIASNDLTPGKGTGNYKSSSINIGKNDISDLFDLQNPADKTLKTADSDRLVTLVRGKGANALTKGYRKMNSRATIGTQNGEGNHMHNVDIGAPQLCYEHNPSTGLERRRYSDPADRRNLGPWSEWKQKK